MMVMLCRLHLVKIHLQFLTCWVGQLRIWHYSACTSTLNCDHLRRNCCIMVALLTGECNGSGCLVRWLCDRWGSIWACFFIVLGESCIRMSWFDSNQFLGYCLQLVAECIQAFLPNILSGIDQSSTLLGCIGTAFEDEGAMETGFTKLMICNKCHFSYFSCVVAEDIHHFRHHCIWHYSFPDLRCFFAWNIIFH